MAVSCVQDTQAMDAMLRDLIEDGMSLGWIWLCRINWSRVTEGIGVVDESAWLQQGLQAQH